MAGLFPDRGVAASQTLNATNNDEASCDPKFHAARCNPKFDPVAANALISELFNASTVCGDDYDCERLDNLARAIECMASLCRLPVEGQPELDDTLAGCFDGESKRVTIADILALADPYSICALPDHDTPALTDTIGGCYGGEDGKATIASILALAGDGGEPDDYIIPPSPEIGTVVHGAVLPPQGSANGYSAPSRAIGDTVTLSPNTLHLNPDSVVAIDGNYVSGATFNGIGITEGTWRAHGNQASISNADQSDSGSVNATVWVRIS